MSYQRVRNAFEIEYPEGLAPNKSTIMRLTKKFEDTGSMCWRQYHRDKSHHCVPTKWRRTFRTCFIMYLFLNTLLHLYRLFFVMWVATFMDHPVYREKISASRSAMRISCKVNLLEYGASVENFCNVYFYILFIDWGALLLIISFWIKKKSYSVHWSRNYKKICG